jgi:serine/threonine protein kinase
VPGDPFGLIGHAIDGQFHVLDVAGEGGFSVVYRGQHLTLREPIAIKCLKFQSKNKNPQVIAQFTQRFFDESRIMYRLSQGNLNIVRAITTGVTMAPNSGETVPYMVLEWLEGKSMAAELKERRQKKLPMPALAQVIAEFEPAALALAYAHSQGVVHRDIKPGNLFLQNTREGGHLMKVLDFGMAKVLSPEAMGGLESAETLGGVMVMSPQYVTPEQLEKAHGAIGAWTDVYSFALIVVEALTNRRAREAESMADLMIQITRDAPPTPMRRGAIVSSAVEMVFERALKRDAKARYADAGAFWADLKRAAAQPDEDAVDMATNVGMKLPMELLKGTLAIPSKPAAQSKQDLSKTMPLAQRTSVAPSQQRPFAGTVPLQSMPEASLARVAALEAVRPSVPQPATSSQPLPAQSFAPPSPRPPPVPMPAPPPAVSSRVVTKRKSNPVLVAFFVLFVLASFAFSALLLVRLYVR